MRVLFRSPATRFVALTGALALGDAAAPAQTVSALPATAPTAMPAPITARQESGIPRHRAKVIYNAGLLNVQANNSSLNGILRDIAQATGMKITGGVADQRVFGTYGPAEPATILATLLDGTGSNMLLRERTGSAPAELVLTPRSGGPTPPNPNAAGFDDTRDEDTPEVAAQPSQPTAPVQNGSGQNPTLGNTALPQQQPATSGPQSVPQPWNNVLGSPSNTTQSVSTLPTVNSVPTDAISTPSVAAAASTGIVDSTNPVPAGSTTFGTATAVQAATQGATSTDGSTNNGAKTPEQIFQQLQQLRQAQGKQSGSTGTTTTGASQPQ